MSALPTQTDVLIVGAGPTGLALGLALRRQGIDCLVIDKLPAALPWSRALGLHARTLEYFDTLGVLTEIKARGLVQKAVQVHGEAGFLFRLDLTALEAPHPYVLSCPQNDVETVLAQHLSALDGMLVRGCELIDFRQSDQQVEAQVRWAEKKHDVHARMMVGCDGASSVVRQQLGFSFDGVKYPDHFLLADVDIDWNLERDSSHGFLLREGALIALPMPEGWRLIINQRDSDDLAPVPDLSIFRQRLALCLGEAPDMGEPRWISRFSIHRRLVNHYRRNRVLLAGDACHIQSPLGAQGLNTGIADACNLAWKLALYLKGHGSGALLDTYEQERRPVASKMLNAVDFLSRSSFARNRFFTRTRDLLLQGLARYRPFGRRLLRHASQLDIHYRDSPLSAQLETVSARNFLQAGDRMPDVELVSIDGKTTSSVHQLLHDGRFQLMVQLGASLDHADHLSVFGLVERIIDEYRNRVAVHLLAGKYLPEEMTDLQQQGDYLWQDAAGAFSRRTHQTSGLWLLRPDGHLGWCGPLSDGDRMLTWIHLWLGSPAL